MSTISHTTPIGVNGIGRIGKLMAWALTHRAEQESIAISTGREVGAGIKDLAAYLEYDSTYGNYAKFYWGADPKKRVEIRDKTLYLNGVKVIWLNDPKYRVAGEIPWADHGVELVFDTTGKATDPTITEPKGLRGHLAHSKKVVLTAPFKIKNKGALMPDDAVTVVGGVNIHAYDPDKHAIISNASCTTNCCVPPIKALVDHFGDKLLSFAITTVHAATNSQSTLDTVPTAGSKDTRKNRSTFNNMIPTSTGAANAVLEVIPEIRTLGIGSQASSIRVPTNTGSIVVMDVSIMGEYDDAYMHGIMRSYSEKYPEVMRYSDESLVSADIIGSTHSTVYDAPFTHRRTSKRGSEYYTMFDLNFWYDNEYGYVCSLLRLYDHMTGRG